MMPATSPTASAFQTTRRRSGRFSKSRSINYFAEEYKAGRTPNPCVMCNEKLKFGTLISRPASLAPSTRDWDICPIEKQPDTGRYLLKRGRRERKIKVIFLFFAQTENWRAPSFLSAS